MRMGFPSNIPRRDTVPDAHKNKTRTRHEQDVREAGLAPRCRQRATTLTGYVGIVRTMLPGGCSPPYGRSRVVRGQSQGREGETTVD